MIGAGRMTESDSRIIDCLLPSMLAKMAYPYAPGPDVLNDDSEQVRAICAALKIDPADVWAKIRTVVHPAPAGLQ
jgi:hypothetical protein